MAEAFGKKPLPYPAASLRLADVAARVERLFQLLICSQDLTLDMAKECLKQVHVLQLLIKPDVNPDMFSRFQRARELCDRMVLRGMASREFFVNLFEMLAYLLSASGFDLALHSPEKSGVIKQYRG